MLQQRNIANLPNTKYNRDPNSNRTTKQHAVVLSIQLNIVTCLETLIRDNVIAPFLHFPLSLSLYLLKCTYCDINPHYIAPTTRKTDRGRRRR